MCNDTIIVTTISREERSAATLRKIYEAVRESEGNNLKLFFKKCGVSYVHIHKVLHKKRAITSGALNRITDIALSMGLIDEETS